MNRFPDHEPDFAFGQVMLTLRTAIGLTQVGLAEYLGVSRRAVGDWEAGNSYPKVGHLKQLVALAMEQRVFPPGSEEDEIRALWRAAHQKVLLDEVWLGTLLHGPTGASKPGEKTDSIQAVSRYATSGARVDWGDALSVQTFYGRAWETALLTQWIVEEHCRVVSVLGLGGIGKSAMVVNLMHQLSQYFDVVIWRSVRDAPSIEALIDDYLGVLAPEDASNTSENRLDLLLGQLRNRRVLLVLDNLETLLAEGVTTGQMRSGYEDYGQFISRLAQTRHQSCLLFTSREKPHDFVALEGAGSQVRTLRLAHLDDTACAELLRDKGITAEMQQVGDLNRVYGGNPLVLSIISQTIIDLFGGDIGPFLAEGAVVYGSVRYMLDQQFSRLSPAEQNVMFWLAILREPVTLDGLLAVQVQTHLRVRLLEAIEALRRRSLLELGGQRGSFTLQSVVLEYVTARLVDEVAREIISERPARLIEHGLELGSSPDYVRQTQQRLLVAPVLAELRGSYGRMASASEQLAPLFDIFRGADEVAQGYGPANLLALLHLSRGNLSGLDLSGLALRSVYLQGVEMQDTSLAGALLRDSVFTETLAPLHAITLSADNRFCAAITVNGNLYVYTLAGTVWREIWRISEGNDFACAFSTGGDVLFTGTWDGRITLRHASSGDLLWSTPPEPGLGMTSSVALAPDGSMIASSHKDGAIHFWDRQDGRRLFSLPHPVRAPALAWSYDGRTLAASDVTGAIHLWAMQQPGGPILSHVLSAHSAVVTSLAFAPDSTLLASGGWDGKIRLWNVLDGSIEQVIDGRDERVNRVAWSPDGRNLAFGGSDATIWLWDIEGRRIQSVLSGHTAGIRGLHFTADSRTLLSGAKDETMRLWNVAGGKCIRVLQSYAVVQAYCAWSPDSVWLATASTASSMIVRPLDGSRRPIVLKGLGEPVSGVSWSPNGDRLAVTSSQSDHTLMLWDPLAGKILQTLQAPTANANYLRGKAAWSPDSQFLACSSGSLGMVVFDLASGGFLRTPSPFPVELTAGAVWSPDGSMLISGDEFGVVYVWDAKSGEIIRRLEGNPGRVQTLEWSPEGDLLAVLCLSAGAANEALDVTVWDMRRSERVHIMPRLSDNTSAWGSSSKFMVGTNKGGLFCWNIESGEQVWQTPTTSTPGLQWLARSPDGNKIASSRDDGTVRIWDLHTGAFLQMLSRDRPYERLNITGINGLSEAQKVTLRALGAIDDTV